MVLNLRIVVGSTRPGRQGPKVADWIAQVAQAHGGFSTSVVDLAELNLPLFNEPRHPVMQQYEHETTKRWAAEIAGSDAVIFVTPEYDSFPNAALVNAVQYLVAEWRYKPVSVVSYGGISGGLRAAQELRQLLSAVGAAAIPQGVPLPLFNTQLTEDGFQPSEQNAQGAKLMLDELAKWGNALLPLHKAA